MNLFRNTLAKIVNKKTPDSRNLAGFNALVEVGFSPADARRALIAANKIRVKRLAQETSVTAPTIFAACYGKRKNPTGMAAISKALNIPVQALFPEQADE
jgi:hypothetical protein